MGNLGNACVFFPPDIPSGRRGRWVMQKRGRIAIVIDQNHNREKWWSLVPCLQKAVGIEGTSLEADMSFSNGS